MDALRFILALIGLLSATAARADPVSQWMPEIAEASRRFGIPGRWIMRVMRAESDGATELDGLPIRSRAGAIGLMQLMPATWREMRRAYALGSNPDDPRANIIAGTAYLRLLYDRFGYPGLFGAYNAGPARYAAWVAGRHHLPSETVAYLGAVAGRGQRTTIHVAVAPRQTLFAIRRKDDAPRLPIGESAMVSGLFAVRKLPR